jgi:predicted secreted hydrolase
VQGTASTLLPIDKPDRVQIIQRQTVKFGSEILSIPPKYRLAGAGFILFAVAAAPLHAEPPADSGSLGFRAAFSYPCTNGSIVFPKDEGLHSPSEWPMTLVEWHAHYAHLKADDGSRYLLFTTFVTFDPVEGIVGGKFPHSIMTLIDVNNAKTYHHRDMGRLKRFAAGHADVETTHGDYFRWKGDSKPFEYDFHAAWQDESARVSVTTELKMLKPPLAVNGTGFIKLPKGESGYYSQTRLAAKGELTVGGETKKVSGIQWIDRQWLGVSFAANLNYYYDWWALQLGNNEEAILFRIKDFDTNAVAMSVLEINHADGRREHVDNFVLSDLAYGWQLSAPSAGWELKITPACKNQNIWQSCDITGTVKGKPITGLAAAEFAREPLEEFRKMMATTPRKSGDRAEGAKPSPNPPAANGHPLEAPNPLLAPQVRH